VRRLAPAVHKYGRTVWLYTKSGHDCTKRFAGLSKALAAIPLPFCIIDGEVVVSDTRGLPNFHALHSRDVGQRQGRARPWVHGRGQL
jgi:ATP-dependent DNA ligase